MGEFRGKSISIKGEVEISKKEQRIANIIGYIVFPIFALAIFGIIPIMWIFISMGVVFLYLMFLAIKYFVGKKTPMILDKVNNGEYEQREINIDEGNKNN